MRLVEKNCRVAVVQAAPVMFDKDACIDKAVDCIREAADNGAELVVFPELFVPCYPFGMTFGYTVGSRHDNGRKNWKRYYDNSVLVPGPDTDILCDAAEECGVYVSIGISERDWDTKTLYNSNIMISPEGELLNCHRKLKPTGAERLVWGDANRGYFPVADTPWGNIGCMICWESYMPLARVALYRKGLTIYISANTNDNPEWQDTIKHIAIEGHVYFINADLFFTKDMYPKDLEDYGEIEKLPDIACRGGSCVVDPYGHYVTEPVWDKEEIIYADLDMDEVAASSMEFDAIGHYARNDVLDLHVNDDEDYREDMFDLMMDRMMERYYDEEMLQKDPDPDGGKKGDVVKFPEK
ncbi:MAG: carbon-nitrogen hydrolase family protein [Anaerovoracaceae bacterium]|jgi:nitrilase